MEWVVLEILAALGALIGIVWWTWPSKKHEEERHGKPPERE